MERGLIFGVLVWGCIFAEANCAGTLVFNMGFAPGSPQAEFQTRLTQEVFSRLGIGTEFVRVGAERALVNVDQGVDDGNLVRVAGLNTRYPNILPVNEEVIRYDFVAVTRRPGAAISDWSSLADHDVAIVTGWKILEDNIRSYRSLIKVRDGGALFELLKAGRVQTVVYERYQAQQIMEEIDCNMARILDPPLVSSPMYIYLNRRHAGLAPQVERALRDFKADGSYRVLYQTVFGKLPP